MSKSISKTLLYGIITVLTIFLAISCSSTSSTDEELVLSGTVTDNSSNEPIEGALVEILSPEELSRYTNTNSDGAFSFGIEIEEPTDIELLASKSGFIEKNQSLRVAPGTDETDLRFALSTPADTADGGGDDGDGNNESSKGSAFISLASVSHSEIRVTGAGGIETSQLTFLVTDSSGTPVNDEKAEYVNFEILEGPSGSTIYPDSVLTKNGEAVATIKSGTESGVVQVMASFTRNTAAQKSIITKQQATHSSIKQVSGGVEVRNQLTRNSSTDNFSSSSVQEIITHQSNPVSVTITGGLPVDEHFEMRSSTKNIVAADNSQSATISVDLADKYGNDVPEGTAVYFSTDRGSYRGSGTTDQQGVVSSVLQPGKPGMALITAETVNESSQKISKQVQVLFFGHPSAFD
ncbi:MAG: carboxypeptidase regulatory-like domain-containing protein [Balneolaceae bacterium]|nr:carboxypeptidase regulatory-like domain-containing protein [Balneolaceae bacterium]